jgi:hypothetical protein
MMDESIAGAQNAMQEIRPGLVILRGKQAYLRMILLLPSSPASRLPNRARTPVNTS